MNNLGIHVYDQFSNIDWQDEIMFLHLMSILSWKKYMGPIHLYCNSKFLSTLKNYGFENLYDYINTDILDNKPNDIDYKQYWAFSKLLIMNKLESPYTLIDTDLYINDIIEFDYDVDVMMYHKENFSIDYEKNVYIDFDDLLPEKIKQMNLDKNLLPTNTAILHIKNNCFVKEWVDLSSQIARHNPNYYVEHPSAKMCFVEQRLLPILLEKKGLKYNTIVKPIYQTHLVDLQDGSEWIPHLPLLNLIDPLENKKFMDIKHLWGIKKLFGDYTMRKKVMDVIINDFKQYLNDYKIFEKFYEKISKKYKREFTN